ncbi:MAG: tetratricopeptide repeat protein [Pirellulales bacterium]
MTSEALAGDAPSETLLVARGEAYLSLGQVELAVNDFSEAIRLAPQAPEAYYQRAVAHDLRGERARAEADREIARRLDPLYAQTFRRPADEDPAFLAVQLAQSAESRALELESAEFEERIRTARDPGKVDWQPVRSLWEDDEEEQPRRSAVVRATPARPKSEESSGQEAPSPAPSPVAVNRRLPGMAPPLAQIGANGAKLPSGDVANGANGASEVELRRQARYPVIRWQSPAFAAHEATREAAAAAAASGATAHSTPQLNPRMKPVIVAPHLRSAP